MTAPMIPGLNDHELPALLTAAHGAGAQFAGFTALRLPFAVAPLFEAWLGRHAPLQKEKVLSRVREMRGGKLNESRFGDRMRGEGEWADVLRNLFRMTCRRLGLNLACSANSSSTKRLIQPPTLSRRAYDTKKSYWSASRGMRTGP